MIRFDITYEDDCRKNYSINKFFSQKFVAKELQTLLAHDLVNI